MKGFTLIEIMVSIAILSLMVALGLFMSFEAYRGATRRSERETIVSMLERARSRAMANIEESSWSVCYVDPDYVIAKGATCDDLNARDRVEANPAVVADSQFNDPLKFPTVIFAQLTGNVVVAPQTITVVQNGKSEEIRINYEGRINW